MRRSKEVGWWGVVVVREVEDLSAAAYGGGIGLLAVEVAVAVAGGALESIEGAVSSGGEKLAAAVDGVAAESDGVVLEALSVPGLPGRRVDPS